MCHMTYERLPVSVHVAESACQRKFLCCCLVRAAEVVRFVTSTRVFSQSQSQPSCSVHCARYSRLIMSVLLWFAALLVNRACSSSRSACCRHGCMGKPPSNRQSVPGPTLVVQLCSSSPSLWSYSHSQADDSSQNAHKIIHQCSVLLLLLIISTSNHCRIVRVFLQGCVQNLRCTKGTGMETARHHVRR